MKNNARYFSNLLDVSSRVPQGSILNRLIFLNYINDLPKAIDQELILFSDGNSYYLKKSNSEIIETVSDVTNVVVY